MCGKVVVCVCPGRRTIQTITHLVAQYQSFRISAHPPPSRAHLPFLHAALPTSNSTARLQHKRRASQPSVTGCCGLN